MKLLHLTGDAEDVGGILSVLRNLQPAFSDMGIFQSVWVNHDYEETRQPHLDYRRSKYVCGFSSSYLPLLRSAIPAYRELRQLLDTEPFDVVHAHSQGTLLIALLLAQKTKTPVFFTNHAYSNLKFLYRQIARKSRVNMVLLTPNMARHFGLFADTAPEAAIVSACAASQYFELPLPTKERSTRIKLVGVGTLMRWKKWDLALDAISLLTASERSKIVFELWGGTSRIGDSEAFARTLSADISARGLDEVFCLRGTTNNIFDVLSGADFMLLPSTNEPCSVALMEALALGIPAIVSRSGGNIDIVQERVSGIFFEPDNAESLSEAIRGLLSNPMESDPATLRESVSMRSPSKVAAAYRDLYEAALA